MASALDILEHSRGLQDGVSFAYNKGIEASDEQIIDAARSGFTDEYAKGFIEGFDAIRTRVMKQDKDIIH